MGSDSSKSNKQLGSALTIIASGNELIFPVDCLQIILDSIKNSQRLLYEREFISIRKSFRTGIMSLIASCKGMYISSRSLFKVDKESHLKLFQEKYYNCNNEHVNYFILSNETSFEISLLEESNLPSFASFYLSQDMKAEGFIQFAEERYSIDYYEIIPIYVDFKITSYTIKLYTNAILTKQQENVLKLQDRHKSEDIATCQGSVPVAVYREITPLHFSFSRKLMYINMVTFYLHCCKTNWNFKFVARENNFRHDLECCPVD